MNPERTAALRRELASVAERLLRNAFKQPGDDDERRKYPTLASIARALVGDDKWRRSPSHAVSDVVGRAIKRLPEAMSGRQPRSDPLSDGSAAWKGSPEREIAYVLYGYRDDELPVRYGDDGAEMARTYDRDYLPAAIKMAGLESASDRQQRRMVEVVREDLAMALFALEPEHISSSYDASADQNSSLSAQPHEPTERSAGDRYVPPLPVEWALSEATQKPTLLLILGEPGVGKRTVARAFIERLPPDQRLVLENVKGPGFMLDLKDRLAEKGVNVDGINDTKLLSELRLLLSGDGTRYGDGWKYVFVPGVNSQEAWDYVQSFLPDRLGASVLVTAERKLVVNRLHRILPMPAGMDRAEARRLAKNWLPDASDRELEMLRCLHGRPVAIVHVCEVLRAKSHEEREDYLTNLSEDVGQTLSSAARQVGAPALKIVYKQLLDELSSNGEEEALLLLKFMAAASWGWRLYTVAFPKPVEFFVNCMRAAYEGMEKDPDVGELAFAGARAILERHQLVYARRESEWDVMSGDASSNDTELLALHPVAQAILADLFGHESMKEIRYWQFPFHAAALEAREKRFLQWQLSQAGSEADRATILAEYDENGVYRARRERHSRERVDREEWRYESDSTS